MKTDPEEWFDVVDASDRVIGREQRAIVHARGLLHRAVHCFVHDASGALLLQLRSAHKDRFPSRWSTSVSGHVDSGETYDEALHRELAEELGAIPPSDASPEYLGRTSPGPETEGEFVCCYRMTWEGPFSPPEDEVSALEWKTIREVKRLAEAEPDRFTPSFLLLLRQHYG
jgi:isopentenyl-diphosphate Delta-isomerase